MKGVLCLLVPSAVALGIGLLCWFKLLFAKVRLPGESMSVRIYDDPFFGAVGSAGMAFFMGLAPVVLLWVLVFHESIKRWRRGAYWLCASSFCCVFIFLLFHIAWRMR